MLKYRHGVHNVKSAGGYVEVSEVLAQKAVPRHLLSEEVHRVRRNIHAGDAGATLSIFFHPFGHVRSLYPAQKGLREILTVTPDK